MLVITLGDPFSVTIECLLRLESLWARPEAGAHVLVGAYEQWLWQLRDLKLTSPALTRIRSWDEVRGKGLYFLDIGGADLQKAPASLTLEERGRASRLALESLRDLHTQGPLAVVTAPIDKYAAAKAGYPFPGQTEFFCDLWQDQGIMILAGTKLRVGLATNHVKLSEVTPLITEERIVQKLTKFDEALKKVLGLPQPRLAVAALNPHAGDQGLFGDEDQRILAPAIARAKALGLQVEGPKPADTLFFQAYSGQYDGVLAMYHDQGLGPLKALHFYDAVNISGGLRHLRISPDHGPAAELYGKNLAKEDSFRLSLVHARKYLGW